MILFFLASWECFAHIAHLKLFFYIVRTISDSQHVQNDKINKESHPILWLKHKISWPSFLLFAGARLEHSIVSPLLQTSTKLELALININL